MGQFWTPIWPKSGSLLHADSQPEIGEFFGGIDYSAVSQARIRLQKKMENDRKSKMRFDQLANKIGDLSSLKI
jgi:hypothetical protein